ncbi:lipid storage droplets surface-binding protein 1 isoform X2 [Homalodisca vitripennis]|uniref:lipid storage droplets surface-binding protein 1 isoform X2 n=1 Tax=Homalodisca vitripennis TaxID=197043 RepID=UPI001EE9E96B|nr:lipid storage droplets surface-binding protein 1 isoform X2 [Homalodisca vitripennis]
MAETAWVKSPLITVDLASDRTVLTSKCLSEPGLEPFCKLTLICVPWAGERVIMATETQKKSHSHHHKHHKQQQQQQQQQKVFHLKSLERISHLPVVESVHSYYQSLKKSSFLIRLSLLPAETGVWLAVGTAMPVVSLFQTPVSAVDSIVCKGLDVIEANIPVINYPPEVVYNITKDYVASNVVGPVLKRADSVKQMSISGANICGELAASRLNNAIDVADKYVEKYLPEIGDGTEVPADSSSPATASDSKTVKTFLHVNQFGRKLQRRLTRRTIAEAKALKQQGADTIRCLVYLVDLLAHDPKAFMEKAKEVWLELSKDEPENQVPPANLEQLIAMLTREMARRVVHLTNYSGTKVLVLTQYGLHAAHIAAYNTIWWADYLLKLLHLDPLVGMAANLVSRFHQVSVDLVISLIEYIRKVRSDCAKSAVIPVSVMTPSPPRSSSQASHTSPASSTSPKPSNSQQNGDSCSIPETNHENPEGQEPLAVPAPAPTSTSPAGSPTPPAATPTTAARSS